MGPERLYLIHNLNVLRYRLLPFQNLERKRKITLLKQFCYVTYQFVLLLSCNYIKTQSHDEVRSTVSFKQKELWQGK